MKKSLMLAGCFLGASLFCNLNASEQKPLEGQGLKIRHNSVQSFVSSVESLMRSEDQQEVNGEKVLATATALLANRLSKLGGLKSDLAVRLAAAVILGYETEDRNLKYVADEVAQALETRHREAQSNTKTLPDVTENMDYTNFPLEGYLMHIFSEVMQNDLRTLSIIHDQNAEFFENVVYANSEEEDIELPVSSEDVSSLLGPNVMSSLANAHGNAEFVKNNEELVQKVNALYNTHAPEQGADWKSEEDMIQKLDKTLTDIGNALGAAKRTIGNDVDMIRDIFKGDSLSCVNLATKHTNGLVWLDYVASMVPPLKPEAEESAINMPVLFSLRYSAMDELLKNEAVKGTFGTLISAEASELATFVEKLCSLKDEADDDQKDENTETEENKQGAAKDYLAVYEKAHQEQDLVGDLTKSLFDYYKETVYVPAASGSDQKAVDNAAKVSLSLANELLWKVFPMEEEQDSQKRAIKMAENTVHYLKAAQIFAALGLYLQRTDFLLEEIQSEKGSDEDIKIDPDQFNEEEDIKIDQNEVAEEEDNS